MMDSVVLVTGGAGFIGSNLCEALLLKGYKVKCLDNLSTGKRSNVEELLTNPECTFIEGDIRDFETCMLASEGVDYVLHQAAWGSVPRSIHLPLLYAENNVKGTLNMMEASLRNNVKKFVYASSSSVYGDDNHLPKMEGREGKPLSPYALTKRINEEYACLYWRIYGLPTIGLRYFNVYGKRQNPSGDYAAVIPKFINDMLEGNRPTIYGDGLQSRDFTYIEDVIQANLRAMVVDPDICGTVYNIAFGGSKSVLGILNAIESELEIKDSMPIFQPPRDGDILHSNADISAARTSLGYEPNWRFDCGIRETVKWFVECKNLELMNSD